MPYPNFSFMTLRPGKIPFREGAVLSMTVLSLCAHADNADNVAPFQLGTIEIVGKRMQVGEIDDSQVASVVTQAQMRQFNRNTMGEALNLLSGVTLATNSRNEQTIAIRGFDARQAPLFIDGIPVYVPYDGYVDFNRFTTSDLASIQVAKGFSSVTYGPNTMGGAINLVSRAPSKALEADGHVGMGSGKDHQASANIGTNQGNWYFQGGASYLQSDTFPLSHDFTPTPTQAEGNRNNAYRKDDKLSLKIGLTPASGDEYALSYYVQHGVKGEPPSTDPTSARYWKWPYWNKESLYYISDMKISSFEAVKLRAYLDKYSNDVDSYTNGTYTALKTSGPGSVSTGQSVYDDQTVGGSVELNSNRFIDNEIKWITHYKQDKHQGNDATGTTTESYRDALISFGLEDNIQLNTEALLSLGLAQDQLRPQEVNKPGSHYSLPDVKTARTPQAGLFYDIDTSNKVYLTIAQKSRLPTLKDRYSARLGSYHENPDLKPEIAINYEIGYKGAPWQDSLIELALFRSDISDMIQSVLISGGSSCSPSTPCQMQNVGKVRSSGIEMGLHRSFKSGIAVGSDYTYDERQNLSSPDTRLTDVPRHKLTSYITFNQEDIVKYVAFMEYDSNRLSSNTTQVASFTTLNAKVEFKAITHFSAEAGINNLTDKNYSLAYGFPNPGRTGFINVDYQL